ncbi:MAG: hypothetical protein ACTS4X_02210 [Candidatus Hodgkinia cicadicola]
MKVKLLMLRSIQAGDKISGRHGNKGWQGGDFKSICALYQKLFAT